MTFNGAPKAFDRVLMTFNGAPKTINGASQARNSAPHACDGASHALNGAPRACDGALLACDGECRGWIGATRPNGAPDRLRAIRATEPRIPMLCMALPVVGKVDVPRIGERSAAGGTTSMEAELVMGGRGSG